MLPQTSVIPRITEIYLKVINLAINQQCFGKYLKAVNILLKTTRVWHSTLTENIVALNTVSLVVSHIHSPPCS